jgi:hypothetical protein
MLIIGEPVYFRIEFVQALVRGDPEVAGMIVADFSHHIVTEAGRIIGVMPVKSKLFCFGIKSIETALRSDSEYTCAVLNKREDDIVTQAVGIVRVVAIDFYAGIVIAVQSVQCANP